MATRITFPAHKKAPYGLTPGKTYTAEMMAFVKVDLRSSYVEPAWKLEDDLGRHRWVPTSLFDPEDSDQLIVKRRTASFHRPQPAAVPRLAAANATVLPPVGAASADDLAAQWEAALNAAS